MGVVMNLPRREFLRLAAGIAALPALPRTAMALDYPTRPVHIIVGFAPGGPNDILARLLGERLSEKWSQPVVVENVAGAGGNVGADRVAKAAPDGYTLLLAGAPQFTINPSLYDRMPFDPAKDLAPVSLVAFAANVLAVHNEIPVQNVQELVAYARARPGQLTFGSAGVGTSQHLAGEVFKSMAHVQMQHIPYRGIAPAITDLLGGRITMVFGNVSNVLPLMREQKLRGLAVTSANRVSAAPELPTIAESGFPGYDVTLSLGFVAPANTQPAIINALYLDTKAVLAQDVIRKRLAELGMEIMIASPDEFSDLIRSETPKWASIIKQAGIKAGD
jgi:tripartite-type tricarboxylate transporter receptor subunit TctC